MSPETIRPSTQLKSFIYGSMYADNVSQLVTIPGPDTFTQVPAGLTAGLCVGVTFQNNKELKITIAGTYWISWSMSPVAATSSNKECEGTIMINGNTQANFTAHSLVSPGGNNRPITFSGNNPIVLAVNDLISMAIKNHTDGADITIEHVTLTALRIGD